MDLHRFKLIRAPRVAGNENSALISGDFTKKTETLLSQGGDAKKAEKAAKTWLDSNIDVLEWTEPGRRTDTPDKKVIAICGAADRWLIALSDLPTGKQFAVFRSEKLASLTGSVAQALGNTRQLISDSIAAEYVVRRDVVRLGALTRLLLIVDILTPALLKDTLLVGDKPGLPVWDWLHRRTVVIPQAYQSTQAAQTAPKQIELVREAKVSDLYVVRNEWSCYKASEIANIINVLAGETFAQEVKKTDEEETVTHEDVEKIEVSEQSEEDRTQSDLAREIERGASASIAAEGSFNVSGQYGVTQFGASGGASASASLSENNRTATRLSRDLVSKAVARVESRVREERTKRRLTRIEDLIKHSIDNVGNPHMRGVFRWVDRVDRYQVFRFPDRLLLEFEIPEPAEYFRWRVKNRSATEVGGVGVPPAFDIKPDMIGRSGPGKIGQKFPTLSSGTVQDYAQLALKFRASNLPPPPDAEISVSAATSGDSALEPEDGKTLWAKPFIHKAGDIVIPTGYLAESISFSGTATPFLGKWRVEGSNGNPINNSDAVEGFHQIVLSACAGDERMTKLAQGPVLQKFTVQLEGNKLEWGRTFEDYSDAFLHFNDEKVAFDVPVKDKVSYSISCSGAKQMAASMLVKCKLSPSAFAEWQNTVYDILLDAWRAWHQEYRTQELQRGAGKLTGFNSTSPSRNKEIVAEELKRQTITWLLDDQNFAGKDAMAPQSTWDTIDLVKAKKVAPVIQFLEQAFEWSNLTYFFYPYFWARGAEWNALADIETNDPEFGKFLRAGSARVIVPARPGFETAIHHWLLYQEPFLSNPLPVPGDPLYVSIAREIQDLTRGPDDGEPGDCWESRMGTPLLWLDPSPDLPKNDWLQLGKAPNQPINPLC